MDLRSLLANSLRGRPTPPGFPPLPGPFPGQGQDGAIFGTDSTDSMAGDPAGDAIMERAKERAKETAEEPPAYMPFPSGAGAESERLITGLQNYLFSGFGIENIRPEIRQLLNEKLSTEQTKKNQLSATGVIIGNEYLDDLDEEGRNWFHESFTGQDPYLFKLPANIGNLFATPERQLYEMGVNAFTEGVQRPKTGAVISYEQEQPQIKPRYFATPFDADETVNAKRLLRAAEEDALVEGLGPFFRRPDVSKYVLPEYLGETPVGQQHGEGPPTMTPDEVKAAKASGKIKVGDKFRTTDGRVLTVK